LKRLYGTRKKYDWGKILKYLLAAIALAALVLSAIFLGFIALRPVPTERRVVVNNEKENDNKDNNKEKGENNEERRDSSAIPPKTPPPIDDLFKSGKTLVGEIQSLTPADENSTEIWMTDGTGGCFTLDPNINWELAVGQSVAISVYPIPEKGIEHFAYFVQPVEPGTIVVPPIDETMIMGVPSEKKENPNGTATITFDSRFPLQEGGEVVKNGKITVIWPPAPVIKKIALNKWNVIRVTPHSGDVFRIIAIAN